MKLIIDSDTVAWPSPVTGVTSTRLKIFLEDNLLTKVEEEVFLPLMARMLDGWGELELQGKSSARSSSFALTLRMPSMPPHAFTLSMPSTVPCR